jgi:mycofactocin precursor
MAEAQEELTEPETAAGTGPGAVEDELLVEEVSIDGMCGVY